MPQLLEAEIQTMVEEHHAPLGVLTKTADAMPGFGIVAAVLGIVITMGSIDGPVEQIGEKVGAALVGTFLGILISYGFLGPLAVRMEILGNNESAFFRTVASIVQGFVGDLAPKVVIEKRGGECAVSSGPPAADGRVARRGRGILTGPKSAGPKQHDQFLRRSFWSRAENPSVICGRDPSLRSG